MRFPDLPGYQFEGLLREGPFAWTFVALHESGNRRAMKVFKAQATNDRFLHRYFKAFSDARFEGSGIARIYDYSFQTPNSHTVCAVPFHGWASREGDPWQMSSLERLSGMLSREQSLEIVRDLAACLGEVHEAGLFHGGVRPSGVFLTGKPGGRQAVCLGEFGEIFMGGLQFLEAGNLLFYVSPEQLSSGDFSNGQGQLWDTYAFGVIAFQVLTGHLPRLDLLRRQCEEHPNWLEAAPAISFGEATDVSEYFLGQLEGEKSVEWPDSTVEPGERKLREVIHECLSFDPARRPASMAEVSVRIEDALRNVAAETTFGTAAVPKVVSAAVAETAPVPVPELGAEEIGEIPAFGFEEIVPGDGNSVRGFFTHLRESPVVLWQTGLVAATVVLLALTFSYLKERKAHSHVKGTVAELQAELKRYKATYDTQVLAYSKAMQEQEKSEQLKSELNEAEDSKSHLIGEAKLARQILRQTQENGDRFFRLVLENRDSDVAEFREGRAKALIEGQKHYERLVEAYGDAPDFIVSTANALFYLGQIYREMGEFGKALASFGEAERRYSALLENTATTSVEFVKNIAISKNALGQLAIKSGQYSVARHYFTESSRFWMEARSIAPEDALSAAIHIHENSLAIVECEFAMDRLDAALDAAASIGVRLADMQAESPENHRVIGALAHSFTLTGRVLEARGENELAKDAYQQSSDLFARAVGLDAAVDAYQLGLGNSLARVGLLTSNLGKLEAAAEVLSAVVAGNPYESTYLKTLADVYGVLARNQRDGGKPSNAVELEKRAISILQPIVDGNRSVAPDVRFSYSQRLAHLAELLGDSGKFDESRVPLREAIGILETIASAETAISEYSRALAKARGMVGFACIKAGDKSEAKEHLELARTEWESVVASNPDDTDAAQAVKWTSEQLKGLQ